MTNGLGKTYLIVLVAVIITASIVALIAYSRGLRLSPDFHVRAAGSIQIVNLKGGENIFIDNSKVTTTYRSGSFEKKNYSQGEHTVLVAREGFWPWAKTVTVLAAHQAVVSPFLIAQNPSGEFVGTTDPDYSKILSLIQNATAPTVTNKKTSKEGAVSIWTDGTKIYAQALQEPTPSYFCTPVCEKNSIVFHSDHTIVNLDFYRNDVVMFQTESGLFTIEIDRGKPQNFQPILATSIKGFALFDNELYVEDPAGNLMHIVLSR